MSKATLQTGMGKVGIDDLAVYIPRIYLPMDALANARGYDFGKLRDGLGLQAMSFPDVHEDPATMAANAVLDLLLRNRLDPRQIGRKRRRWIETDGFLCRRYADAVFFPGIWGGLFP